MSRLVSCARCGEEELLRGERQGDTIQIVCESCDLRWERDLTPRCPTCGNDDVRPAFQAVVEKSRGTQLSMQSARLIYLCPECDRAKLNDYHKTNSPLMPAELPTTTMDDG